MSDRLYDVQRMTKDLAFAELSPKGKAVADWPESFGPKEIAEHEEIAYYLIAQGWTKP